MKRFHPLEPPPWAGRGRVRLALFLVSVASFAAFAFRWLYALYAESGKSAFDCVTYFLPLFLGLTLQYHTWLYADESDSKEERKR